MIWYAGGKFGFFNLFISHRGIRKFDRDKFNSNCKTNYITGCCLFISKKSFVKLNGFDESFDMYGEDVDLCIRAKKEGIKIKLKGIRILKVGSKVSECAIQKIPKKKKPKPKDDPKINKFLRKGFFL